LLILLFSFTDTLPPETYTLSLHDALPIFRESDAQLQRNGAVHLPDAARNTQRRRRETPHRPAARPRESHPAAVRSIRPKRVGERSEEHTSELQSRFDLVCRLLLEKKNNQH